MNITVAGDFDIPAKECFAYRDRAAAKLAEDGLELDHLIIRTNADDPDRVDLTYTARPVAVRENIPRKRN